VNDKPEGKGKMTHKNGDIYEGIMKNSKKHGAGTYKNKQRNELWEGSWDMDKKDGDFVEHRNNEKLKVTGVYKLGEKHGKFVILDTNTNEEVRTEQWNEGVLTYE
jgi:hypothetical protein